MVSDKELKSHIPLFVKGGGDHKCGTCAYRMGKDKCSFVSGYIDFKNGTCAYWAEGREATDKEMPMKMTPEEAQYLVADGKVQCGTCRFYQDNKCQLWDGNPVEADDCCIAWTDGKLRKSISSNSLQRRHRNALVDRLLAQYNVPCSWCPMNRPGREPNMIQVPIPGSSGLCEECAEIMKSEIKSKMKAKYPTANKEKK